MSLWDRIRGGGQRGTRDGGLADADYLRAWAAARTGVEAYLEPRTLMIEMTVVLVASDGEWTRRRITSPAAARRLARSLRIPLYDVRLVGYPRRMRDYNARRRIERRRELDH
jgi:hypothetical protein